MPVRVIVVVVVTFCKYGCDMNELLISKCIHEHIVCAVFFHYGLLSNFDETSEINYLGWL